MSGNGAAAGASYGDLLITSLVVLGAVCIAAFVAVRVFGRLLATNRVRGAHLLDVVARVPLEPRRSLYVVEVAGKTLLVGTSEMGLSVLSELDAGAVKSCVQAQPSFGELVRSAWLRRKGRRAAGVTDTVAGDRAHVGMSPMDTHVGTTSTNGDVHVGTVPAITDARVSTSALRERAHVGTRRAAAYTNLGTNAPNERAHVGTTAASGDHASASEPADAARDATGSQTEARAASST